MRGAEVRAVWIDSWHDGLQSPEQVTAVISNLRKAHFNTAFVEVRRRGETLYKNSKESQIPLQVDFDPLSYFLQLAHNTNMGSYIEVHAWFVTYPVATTVPKSKDHPLHKHPDWLSQTQNGETFTESDRCFDPGHPQVQQYLFDMVMDLVTRYGVDGIHFDYVRYEGRDWGYNPVSVARFRQLNGYKDVPTYSDARWQQFRRDQITQWLRKAYLSTIAIKPLVKVSASTVTRTGFLSGNGHWTNSIPYQHLLQDWRGWMEEGILDMNVSMNFFRQAVPQQAREFDDWSDFLKDSSFQRQTVIGLANWLNSSSNIVDQIQIARKPSAKGQRASGTAFYSYASPASGPSKPFMEVVGGSHFVESTEFQADTPVPDMPWKSHPTTGYLKGFVYQRGTSNAVDGANVYLQGAANTEQISDATGFFGVLDLAPGQYSIHAQFRGVQSTTNHLQISAGKVTTLNLVVPNR